MHGGKASIFVSLGISSWRIFPFRLRNRFLSLSIRSFTVCGRANSIFASSFFSTWVRISSDSSRAVSSFMSCTSPCIIVLLTSFHFVSRRLPVFFR